MRKKSGSLFNVEDFAKVCMLVALAFGTKLDWGWQYLPKLLTCQLMFDKVSHLTCVRIQCKIRLL